MFMQIVHYKNTCYYTHIKHIYYVIYYKKVNNTVEYINGARTYFNVHDFIVVDTTNTSNNILSMLNR